MTRFADVISFIKPLINSPSRRPISGQIKHTFRSILPSAVQLQAYQTCCPKTLSAQHTTTTTSRGYVASSTHPRTIVRTAISTHQNLAIEVPVIKKKQPAALCLRKSIRGHDWPGYCYRHSHTVICCSDFYVHTHTRAGFYVLLG